MAANTFTRPINRDTIANRPISITVSGSTVPNAFNRILLSTVV